MPKVAKVQATQQPEPAKSAIADYASELSTLGEDKISLYRHMWVTKQGHAIDAHINQSELADCLKAVNSNHISDNEVQFALMSLDLVQATAAGNTEKTLPYDFRMFCTIAYHPGSTNQTDFMQLLMIS